MIELELAGASARHIRFAVSPLEEAIGAVQVLLGVRTHPMYETWLATARAAAPDTPELLAVLSGRRYITDFLSPPPRQLSPPREKARPRSGPHATVREQLAAVRATPAEQVARELAMVDAELGVLPDDPARARDLLADQLELAWTELIEPHWPRLHQVLLAEIDYRAGQLAERGLAGVFADLHPRVHLTDHAVLVDTTTRSRATLDERGLVLLPNVFGWPRVGVVLMPPWQPCLSYPARGAAEVWHASRSASTEDVLAGVLGRTKARLLLTLESPANTTALAGRMSLAAGTVSAHLTALRAAGLLTAHRRGRAMTYRRSDLGDDLCRTVGWQ